MENYTDMSIEQNIKEVQKSIFETCLKNNRDTSQVTLIAVSKTKPYEALKEAYDAGIRDFGENKVQEILEKYDLMPADTRFHMIGHLQRNKVKYIIDKVTMIHSVDTLELAEQISREAVKKNVTMPVLLEVNIAAEESKFGFQPKDILAVLPPISKLEGIKVKGLMTVAPFTCSSETNRKYFRQLKELSVDITKENIDNITMSVLSMGMSGDYLVAVEEGATAVRVGTGIFGKRNYCKSEV